MTKRINIDSDIYNDYYDLAAGFKRLNMSCSVKKLTEKALENYLPQLQKELEVLKGVEKK